MYSVIDFVVIIFWNKKLTQLRIWNGFQNRCIWCIWCLIACIPILQKYIWYSVGVFRCIRYVSENGLTPYMNTSNTPNTSFFKFRWKLLFPEEHFFIKLRSDMWYADAISLKIWKTVMDFKNGVYAAHGV